MILVIDNYDSFTYNTVQILGTMNQKITTVRNDKISVEEAEQLNPEFIVISPGPGWPQDAGVSNKIIKAFYEKIPVLGICLGNQCIVQAFGGKIINAPKLLHGKASRIYHDSRTIYSGLPNPILGGRYHSLIADEKSLPECLEVASYTPEGEIMGVRHKDFPVEGVQFHPESILTELGRNIFQNFLNLRRRLL